MSEWPDDADVARRREFIATRLGMGMAICPRCLLVHAEAGEAHLKSPWRITPRCTDCGEALKMPEWPPYKEMA